MSTATNCIFCKIANSQVPSHRILDTPKAMAFLDIGPLAAGHVLLIPKPHYRTLAEVPSSFASDLASLLPKLCKIVQEVSGADGYNILQNNGKVAGQEVGHVHFHIIPRREGDGLGYRWLPKKYDPGQAEQLCEQLIRAWNE